MGDTGSAGATPATPAAGATSTASQSAATPPATEAPSAPAADATSAPDTGELGEAGKRAIAAERQAKEAAERAAKAATAELDKLRKSAMSDQEKAIAVARDEGKAEAIKAAGERLAAAKIEAALTGVVPDPAAIVEDLALARYVSDDGEPDTAAIGKLKEKYAALAPSATPPPAVPGVAAGARQDNGVKQLSRAELQQMKPAEIVEARKAGRLRDVLSTGT